MADQNEVISGAAIVAQSVICSSETAVELQHHGQHHASITAHLTGVANRTQK